LLHARHEATRNYHVTVVTDGVATIDPAIEAACFDIWRRKFARLRTTAQMLAEQLRLPNTVSRPTA